MRVLVEIDVGAHRCGVPDPERAAALAAVVDRASGLVFGGLQAYHGSAQHKRTPQERRAAVETAAVVVNETLAKLGAEGIACPMVTGGGTGTLFEDIERPEWTELQCGSYAFMDADYARNFLTDNAAERLRAQPLCRHDGDERRLRGPRSSGRGPEGRRIGFG